MRAVVVPKDVTLPNGEAYNFKSFLAEFCWSDIRWADEWAVSYDVATSKLEGATAGAVVLLPDEEHGRVILAIKAKEVATRALVMKFFHAFTQAKVVDSVPEAAAAQ